MQFQHKNSLSLSSDGLTLKEVGKTMGLTRERVRQIEAKALLKLRKSLNLRNIQHINQIIWAPYRQRNVMNESEYNSDLIEDIPNLWAKVATQRVIFRAQIQAKATEKTQPTMRIICKFTPSASFSKWLSQKADWNYNFAIAINWLNGNFKLLAILRRFINARLCSPRSIPPI